MRFLRLSRRVPRYKRRIRARRRALGRRKFFRTRRY